MSNMQLNLINSDIKNKGEVYKMISDFFVSEGDMESILNFCKKNNAKVTFRDAGAESIKQLERGTGAKPHSILEKSIKMVRLTASDKKALSAIVGKDKLELILGLVGRWSKQAKQTGEVNKDLKGLYLTSAAVSAINGDLKSYAPIIKPPNTLQEGKSRKNYFIKLALTQQDEQNMRNKAANKVKKLVEELDAITDKNSQKAKIKMLNELIDFEKGPCFEIAPYYISYKLSKKFLKKLVSESGKDLCKYLFSGDYDLHDLFTNRAFAQDSFDEKRLLNELNKNINSHSHRKDVLEKIAKSDSSNYNMIQHGAQEKYLANMANNEKGKPIDQIVAKIHKGALAACSPKGWEIVKGFKELSEFYSKSGLTIKQNWGTEGEIKRSVSTSSLNFKKDFSVDKKRANTSKKRRNSM